MRVILSFIYSLAVPSPGSAWLLKLKTRLFGHLRQRLLSLEVLKAAPVSMRAHGETLGMPLAHNLPLILANKPLYDSVLNRVAHYLRKRDGFVSLVDVGANIGDTVIACRLEPGDTALCIEPNPEYWPYLQQNLQASKGRAVSSQTLVGARDGVLTANALTSQGTARYIPGETGETIPVRSIPSLMAEMGLDSCNFLKIDTDGHDFECLRGAESLLKKSMPIVLFEADIFANTNYDQELIDVVSMLVTMSYKVFVVYTNDGCFFHFYTANNIKHLYNAVLYQALATSLYFDILALSDDTFLRDELSYFVKRTKDPVQNRVAHNVVTMMSESTAH
jgi:FkbM family methyltransferase